MKNNGCFVSFEGGEGTGKTTQVRLLAEKLRISTTREIVASRSPGGTAVAEKIRAILKERTPGEDLLPETELLLFGACHAQMCENLIRPALARGAILLTDRFTDSTLVYQGCARGLDPEFIAQVGAFACKGTTPDLTFLLDLDPETGVARATARSGAATGTDRFDSESMAFHRAVRQGFLTLANRAPERFAVIDASKPTEEVHKQIWEAFHERMGIV